MTLSVSVAGLPAKAMPFSVRPISWANVLCGTHLVDVRGVVSSNILSICSRERPLVSGTKKYAKEKMLMLMAELMVELTVELMVELMVRTMLMVQR